MELKKILLVEDSKNDAFLVRRLLYSSAPFFETDLLHVATLEQARKILDDKGQSVDVVLLDLNLPDSKGVESINAFKTYANIPIIIITGEKNMELAFLAIKSGASDFLFKQDLEETQLVKAIYFAIVKHELIAAKLAERERFKLVVDGISVGIIDWPSIHAKEQYWSSKFYTLLGYSNNEIEANADTFTGLIHPEDRERAFAIIDAQIESKDHFNFECRLQSKTKNYRWFRVAGCVACTEGGQPERMVGSIEDIHEKKIVKQKMAEYTQKLAASNRDLEEFAYAASHDLKEPLRTISSYLQLIERRHLADLKPEALEFFDIIKDSCSRMKVLIADLLEYSRIVKSDGTFKSIDVNQMIEALVSRFQAQCPELSFHLHLEGEHYIEGVPSFIERLFTNVIGNAIKYRHAERDPVIDISTTTEADKLVVLIKDNGIGIGREYTEKIFAIFQRLHSMEEYSGTGVGLAICKRIAQMHNGNISVSSCLGTGSEFNIQLALKPN